MVQVIEAMQLPLFKNQIMQKMRSYCLLCEVIGTGYAPPLYPLSSFLCGVCMCTRISASVYGLCVLLLFMDNASLRFCDLLSCNNFLDTSSVQGHANNPTGIDPSSYYICEY